MARRRFFVDRIHHQQAELVGDEAHHLTRVLRVEAGQHYEITDGQDIFLAEVAEARKSRVLFTIGERIAPKPQPVRVHLYLALVKFERMELVFEKGTELGIVRYIPVIAQRSEKGLDRAVDKRMERWRRIVLEASQQSRRDHLPEVAEAVSFGEAVKSAPGLRYFADEAAADGAEIPALLNAVPSAPEAQADVSLLIGPEGGWTEGERTLAATNAWQPVALGPLVLRVETAAIIASAILCAHWDARATKATA